VCSGREHGKQPHPAEHPAHAARQGVGLLAVRLLLPHLHGCVRTTPLRVLLPLWIRPLLVSDTKKVYLSGFDASSYFRPTSIFLRTHFARFHACACVCVCLCICISQRLAAARDVTPSTSRHLCTIARTCTRTLLGCTES